MAIEQAIEHSPGVTTETLVASAIHGDVAALERIVAAFHPDMTHVAMVICGGDADLADEAVQAAWPIAWRSIDRLRDPARLRPWLVSIAANEARQLLRRRWRRSSIVEIAIADTDLASGHDDIARSIERADLGEALHRLSPDDRALLALRYVAGFDSVEIGRVLNLSASGVRSRLERLLGRLRMELGDD